MQRRSARSWIAVAQGFAAMIVASCGGESTTTGPQIATISIVSGSGQTAAIGSTLAAPFVVIVTDQAGTPVVGETVTWTVVSGGGTMTPSQSTTGTDGHASATLRVGTTPGANRVQASLGNLQPVEFLATATSAPPAKLVIAAGNAQVGTAGAQLGSDISVRVTDAVDTPKPGIVVNFTVSGGGSLSATSATTDASGIASVHWTLGTTAGVQSVLASVAGLTPVTFTATANAGPPVGISIVSGNNQNGSPGSPLPDSLRVKVVDQFGNGVSGVEITWAPAAGNGSVSPAITTTDATGQAATRWTLGSTGGPLTVTASGAGFVQTFSGGGNVTYNATSAGSKHSCALSEGGVAYCWGYNGDGQLGIGADVEGSGPVFALPQPTGATGNLTFAKLFGAFYHTCGLTLSGVGECWGVNVDGRLGIGTFEPVNEPTQIKATVAFSIIAPGQAHTCALDLAHVAYCWGRGSEGQLGVGSIPANPEEAPRSLGASFRTISAGGLHTCAIDAGGAGWCWGNNFYGQLGDGSGVEQLSPAPIAGGLSLNAISAGKLHSCALDTNGAAFCWGRNDNGQLGNGGSTGSTTPVAVSGGLVFVAISAGTGHTCALTGAGALYCWGKNDAGQLGDGTTVSKLAPTLVAGGLVFAAVSVGEAHTCAVTTGHIAYCWGDNQFGQLGDGTLTTRTAPAKVAFQP